MALFAMLTAFTIGADDAIACTLRARDTDQPMVLAVTLEPVPSLKDRPGLYRVMVEVEGTTLRGNAQPMAQTAEDDVMIRAKSGDETFYTLGLRRDGAAAMYVSQTGASLTLTGWCQRHERWFPGWLSPAG